MIAAETIERLRELRKVADELPSGWGLMFTDAARNSTAAGVGCISEFGIKNMGKEVRELARSLPLVSVRYLIRRPHVICIVLYGYQVSETESECVEGIGVSKVSWPDRFNVGRGKVIALGRARLDLAKKLCGEPDVFVEEGE